MSRSVRPMYARGLLVVVAGVGAGFGVWSLAVFGPYRSGVLSWSGVANSALLSAAGLISVRATYAPLFRVRWQPHGLAESPKLGSWWLPVALGFSLLIPWILLAEGPARARESLPLWAGTWSTWVVVIETMRRTRVPAGPEDWTDLRLDSLAVNIEAAAGGAWVTALGAIAFAITPSDPEVMVPLIAMPLVVGVAVTYARSMLALMAEGYRIAWIVVGVMACGLVFGAPAEGVQGQAAVLVVAAACVAASERARRRARTVRIQQLIGAGDEARLIERYGPARKA